MKKCNLCGEEKSLDKFYIYPGRSPNRCKECICKAKRTGKPNAGRFKKGVIPPTAWKKGNIPVNKGKKGPVAWNKGISPPEAIRKKISQSLKGRGKSENRSSVKYKEWRLKVFERDGFKCKKCESTHRLHAHHKIRWEENITLRFCVENGITLCISCHAKLEGFQKGHILSEESKKKMSQKLKGRISPLKGKKFTEEHKQKLRDSHNRRKNEYG